jgi:hypothetical protein
MKVSQPSSMPTRKLSAAVVASALIALARWAVPALDDDALWIGLTPLIVLGVGYFVRDNANVDPFMPNDQRGV